MSNGYFDFKQFRIEQGRTAMKVSTDACIQGAWTPVPHTACNALDIGSGTGLLALMLAQRFPGLYVDAIELDEGAVQDARQNFDNTCFRDRLSLLAGDIRFYSFSRQYDTIIANPPFFSNSMLSADAGRNTARHSLSLSLPELFRAIKRLLLPHGTASILLPVAAYREWEAILAEAGWSVVSVLHIIPKPGAAPNRVVSICSAMPGGTVLFDELLIRDHTDAYTPEFVRLLTPFYLTL